MESNTHLFNPRKLPAILVPAANLPRDERNDPRLREFLERAKRFLDDNGQLLRLLGPGGAAASAQAARKLDLPEGRNFALALLSAMASQASELPAPALAELAQELLRYRVVDKPLWQALVDSAVSRPDLGPAELVSFLDASRRSLAMGIRPSSALESICRRCAERAEEFTSKQLVGAIGSVSRLGNHLSNSDQYKAVQLMLDRWLADQAAHLEGTPSSQIVSLAVSLTNVSDFLGVRTDAFVDAAAGWALRSAAPAGGVLSAEELIVLLWALKELTALGLGPHRMLVEVALPRIREEAKLEDWTLLRLVQSLEVLLAARHALAGEAMLAVATSGEEDLQALEDLVSAALAKALATDCNATMLTRLVTLGEQVGDSFWSRSPVLVEAVLSRAIELASNPALAAAELHPLLDTIAASSVSRAAAFKDAGRAALCNATASRRDASSPALAAALRSLEEPSTQSLAAAVNVDSKLAGSGIEMPTSLSPIALAERLGQLCKHEASELEVSTTAEAFLAAMGSLRTEQLGPALEQVLKAGRRRLARDPLLLEVVERLGDQIAAQSAAMSTWQLLSALDLFSTVGLPYHLLFESVLLALLERHRVQGMSWGQAIGVLESFAAVRLRIPELSELYGHLRRPQELARLPTMALVRLLSAASRLELTDEAGLDAREIIDRILAETTPQRPLPLDDTVVLFQSLLLSGSVPPDRQLRHIFTWVAGARVPQLSAQQLAVMRQYSLFVLAQEDENSRSSLLRLPVEMQSFVSGLLRHRASLWTSPSSDTTRRFRAEVSDLLLSEQPPLGLATSASSAPGLQLGPAGSVDAQVGQSVVLLDGPEAFFRPFSANMHYTPQEIRRGWLLGRLLGDPDARRCVADFYPPALVWPQLGGPRRLNWLEWGRALPKARSELLGLGRTSGGLPR
ncbi:unnamed protein product [Polarella glacialis]|uniref:Uncharacterized protein n=1 Tax=Polarella glacialis TaxID=89957 RepID=A0A813KWJ4_POLGL|nr:unnamed protein product [Polarella glacialis]